MVTVLPSTIWPSSTHRSGSRAKHLHLCSFTSALIYRQQRARQIRCSSQQALPSEQVQRFSEPHQPPGKATQGRPASAASNKRQRVFKYQQPQLSKADPELLRLAARRLQQQDSQKLAQQPYNKPALQQDNRPALQQHNKPALQQDNKPALQQDNRPASGKNGSRHPAPSAEYRDGALHPGKLNKLIVEATSIEEILELYAVHKDGFNTINLATAFYRLARKLKALRRPMHFAAELEAVQKHPEMKHLAKALTGRVHGCDGWGLINVCWAQSAMSLGPPELMRKVVQLISERSRENSEYIPAKDLPVVVWGAAKQGCLTRAIWDQFSPELTASLSQYKVAALSNVLWACATQKYTDDRAFITAAAQATIRQKSNLADQPLANIAWSFANLRYFEGGLWGVLTSQGLANIPCMSGTDMGMYVWAMTQRLKADAAVTGLDLGKQSQTLAHRKSFISQGDRATLLNALRNRLGQLLAEKQVTLRVLAMSLSAMSSVGYYSAGLMDAAADHFVPNIQTVKFHAMVSMMWACSCTRHYHPAFFRACAVKVLDTLADPQGAPIFTPLTISILVYAFSTHTVDPEDEVCMEMVRQLCDRATETLNTFDEQALTNTAWGFAVLGHLHPPFFRKVRAIAPTKLPLLKLEELSQLYQLELILRLEAPDLGLDLSHLTRYEDIFAALQARGELAGLARARWQQLKDPTKLAPSVFQKDVSAATTLLSLGHNIELEFCEEEYTVDIAFPEARVVIEADGPLHFMRNAYKATGRTIVKRRSLQQLGWTVLSIPYFHWDFLETFTQKMAYMERCLGQVGIHTVAPKNKSVQRHVPDAASSRLIQQELGSVNALVASREQLGLVCRPFPAAVSVHDQDGAPLQSYTDTQQQNQVETPLQGRLYTQQQNSVEAAAQSYKGDQQPNQGQTPLSSYVDTQQQNQVAASQSYTGSQQQEQVEAAAESYSGTQQQNQNEMGVQSYSETQQLDVEEPALQPQRLSVYQQQALLRKRTGKAQQSRLELILQVAKNRKEAAAQRQLALDDMTASES